MDPSSRVSDVGTGVLAKPILQFLYSFHGVVPLGLSRPVTGPIYLPCIKEMMMIMMMIIIIIIIILEVLG